MAYTSTSDTIIIKAALTEKGRKLLSRGKFKVAKFAFGDDEIDYTLVEPNLLNSSFVVESGGTDISVDKYVSAVENSKIFEAYSDRKKNILYGLNSYDEGVLYLTEDELEVRDNHAHILYIPILKSNKKVNVSPTLSGSVYYLSVNDETTEQLDKITNTNQFRFLTTNKLENVKIVIESGIDPSPKDDDEGIFPSLEHREHYITKKFLLDHDYYIYADNKYIRKIVGITQNSKFENFPSGDTVINLKTGVESSAISLESEFESYATFITRGVPNLIAAYDADSVASDTGNQFSEFTGPRGSVVAFNPLIDQELQSTSTSTRDFRYSEYGYTDQIVFSELPNSKFDYIDTTIYVIGGTTNSRVRIPIRTIRFTGT